MVAQDGLSFRKPVPARRKSILHALLIPALLAVTATAPVHASVPRVVLLEAYTTVT